LVLHPAAENSRPTLSKQVSESAQIWIRDPIGVPRCSPQSGTPNILNSPDTIQWCPSVDSLHLSFCAKIDVVSFWRTLALNGKRDCGGGSTSMVAMSTDLQHDFIDSSCSPLEMLILSIYRTDSTAFPVMQRRACRFAISPSGLPT
jgi:hypothetical protein